MAKVGLVEVTPPGFIEYEGELRLLVFAAVITVDCPRQRLSWACEHTVARIPQSKVVIVLVVFIFVSFKDVSISINSIRAFCVG
jgi:hypothetical protein